MSDFRIVGLYPVLEPVALRGGYTLIAHCDLIIGRARVCGCSVVQDQSGATLLWSPLGTTQHRSGRPVVRFGPDLMAEAGEDCRSRLEMIRKAKSAWRRTAPKRQPTPETAEAGA